MRLGAIAWAGVLLVGLGCALAPLASAQSTLVLVRHEQPDPASSRLHLISCSPTAVQSGAVLCHVDPGAELALDGKPVARADENGLAVIGLSRSQASPAKITFVTAPDIATPYSRRIASALVEVTAREDKVSRFTMECGKISAQTPEQKRHAEVSWLKKDAALKSFNAPVGPVAFTKPADGPYSSPFGVTRTYMPKTKDCEGSTSVHNGLDIAVPTGTELRAPMAGTVILADPDLFYEGGAVFLDHGRGLVSVMMHMSRVDVKAGDVVQQGGMLGLTGATGRVTGPHLHWAIKYRNPFSDDRGTDIWLDPKLMLTLAETPPVAPAVELVAAGQ